MRDLEVLKVIKSLRFWSWRLEQICLRELFLCMFIALKGTMACEQQRSIFYNQDRSLKAFMAFGVIVFLIAYAQVSFCRFCLLA